jgi:hypothetical protein
MVVSVGRERLWSESYVVHLNGNNIHRHEVKFSSIALDIARAREPASPADIVN